MTTLRNLLKLMPLAFFVVVVAASFAIGVELPLFEALPAIATYLAFAVTGTWIAHRSGNRIGYVFQAVAVTGAVVFVTQTYLESTSDPGSLPNGAVIAWINNVSFILFFALQFVLPFMLFPTGRPASPWWGRVMKVVWIWIAIASLSAAVAPRLELADGTIANPLAIEQLKPVTEPINDQLFNGIMLFGIIAIVSLVSRFRKSSGDERAQLKWFLFAGAFLIAALLLDEVILDMIGFVEPRIETMIETLALVCGLLGLPVATTIAILKYRLYDIDVVINRTLVYGALTAALLGSYLLIVFALSRVLGPVTRDSDIAVAASTLAVAALFRPLRARVQAFIDRRFYRAKYDARRALGDFTARLRNEVEIDLVRSDVLGVVGTTLQPSHASLWIRAEATR